MTVQNYTSYTTDWTKFSLVEHFVFFGMLGCSAMFGIYFGCIQKKQDTILEYMFGGKKMSTLPVSLSLLASLTSGVMLLGLPAEVYVHGTQVYAQLFSQIILTVAALYMFLPVLYPLQLKSVSEYLEMRFNRNARYVSSLLFTIDLFTYIPLVIYVPALAFKQVTGISVHILTPIVCGICIFYTTLGGLKAVVWSDTFQTSFILISIFTITILGLNDVGGLSNVIEASEAGHRLELFNMDTNLFTRNSFIAIFIGTFFNWSTMFTFNPAIIQRFTSLPSFRSTVVCSLVFLGGLIFVRTIVTMNGLIIYTKYADCDPVLTESVAKAGQVLPLYIMSIAKGIPGFAGLFIAGVFSAALSTMSTGLNTIAGTIYEDFIKPNVPWKFTDSQASRTVKLLVVVLGALSVLLIFLIEKLGGIIQVAISLGGIACGPIFYLFVSGMCFPWATSKSAISGAVAGLLFTAWVIIGAQTSIASKEIQYPGKVLSVEGCPANMTLPPGLNGTSFGFEGIGSPGVFQDDVPYLYRISFYHYGTLGALVSFTVGLIVTFLTGSEDLTQLNPDLIIPQMRRFLPRKPLVMQQEQLLKPPIDSPWDESPMKNKIPSVI